MWNGFINLLFTLLNWVEGLVGDWGLAIIIFTAIIRVLLTPLTVKSTKSSAKMQALQPQLKAIQERYADQPEQQAAAMREFYAENKFNPLGGCLPVFLQMPIFFALFTVLRDMLPSHAHFYGILDSLAMSVQQAIADPATNAVIFITLDVLFGVLTLVPMMLNAKNSDPAQQQQMKVMGLFMGVMMVWVGWKIPVGVLLYYNTSAIWGVIQQVFITNKVMKKVKEQEEERLKNAPIQVDVVRRERKPRPRKKN